MLGRAASAPATPSDQPWKIFGVLHLYRLLVAMLLLGVQQLLPPRWAPATPQPRLFFWACLGYFAAAALLFLARRLPWPSLRLRALANAGVDSAGVALILFAKGGVASGLGILLVPPVMALAVLTGPRAALAVAAIAAGGVLLQQLLGGLYELMPATDFTAATLLVCMLFAVALSASPIANRLRESVDLEDLAELSQHVLLRLRESILVVGSNDRILLINGSAARMLGDSARTGAQLGEVSPRLLSLFQSWRQSGGVGAGALADDIDLHSADGASLIRAYFAPIAKEATIVFLEDTNQVPQSNLAALARLSAGIAHEVKNPVAAMSSAGQLLAESPRLNDQDRRLTQIIRANADRVSAIINNVLALSRGEETRLERLSLKSWAEEFRQEFCDTMQLARVRLTISGPAAGVEVLVDPGQLRQIAWNLCENALQHAAQDTREELIELRYGRMTRNLQPFLEVRDRGPGVPPEHAKRIFEPFFSAGRGTGLGLFLARELAQTNRATLLYEARKGGGSTFRITFADPERWQELASA
jgi:two-component system sensor histidine kinase PilS (NtrC family)